jgi:RNA polymerase sigma-70 factor (ECF subfamily)
METTSLTLLEKLRQPGPVQSAAFERFVKLYSPLLLVWVKRLGFRGADAEDRTQEILIKLIGLPGYRRGEGQKFRSWLFRVAKHHCLDCHRRLAARPRAIQGDAGLSEVADRSQVAEDEGIDEAEYRLTLLRQLMELVRPGFSDRVWAAFTAHKVQGRPAAEVAEQLGLTKNAVYLACHRVLTRLREERKELDDFFD